ncbi:MAG: amidohydrolase [Deltaproteobacteria bacterium RBG_13_43_22]|nr:MAG: amidohydrolase [Deltaproteobacteria bacterium RBG_13_43_22]
MTNKTPGTPEWLAQVVEEIVEPERPIVDPHHHLWERPGGRSYLLKDLWADTGSGHRIVKTVFIECHASYRTEGPEHLRPIGETEFVAGIAAESAKGGKGRAEISAIVAHADLTLGHQLEEVLQAHEEAGQGLFKGIRHAGASDKNKEVFFIPGRAPEHLYQREDFRQGLKVLARRGLTYDTWHYHHQNPAFAELARAVPETRMILDHFGTPLGVGPYRDKREEIFAQWKKDIAEIAKCENVFAKLGGLAMPDNGFGWHTREIPPSSAEFIEAQKRYYMHTIECFGPKRCMFESNFPVDKFSLSYPVVWNAFKKLVADFSEDEKEALFRGTATQVYRLG